MPLRAVPARPSPKRRVLIVGCAGFLGREVCAAALEDGLDVHGAGRSPTAPTGLAARGLTYHRLDAAAGDARVADLLATLRPDAVVNAAGTLWTTDPTALHRGNVSLAAGLVDAVTELAGSTGHRARLVHLGSMYECRTDGRDQDVADPILPGYARTKILASQLVRESAAAGDTDAVVLRLSTIVGPGMAASSSIGRAVQVLHESSPGSRVHLPVVQVVRDYLDVRDAANAILRACHTAGLAGDVLPVGRGTLVAVSTMLCELAVLAHRNAEIDLLPATGPVWAYPAADLRRTKPVLGWVPEHDLVSSLRAVWNRDPAPSRAGFDQPFRSETDNCLVAAAHCAAPGNPRRELA